MINFYFILDIINQQNFRVNKLKDFEFDELSTSDNLSQKKNEFAFKNFLEENENILKQRIIFLVVGQVTKMLEK